MGSTGNRWTLTESGHAGAVLESALVRGSMKYLAFVFLLLAASATLANDKRDWKEAKVARIASSVEDDGAVVGSVGTAVVGGRIRTTAMYY